MMWRLLTDIICTAPSSCCTYEYSMHKKQISYEKALSFAVKKQNALVLKRTAREIDELDKEMLIISSRSFRSVYYNDCGTFPTKL